MKYIHQTSFFKKMSQPPVRRVWKIVLTNFIKSFRPKQIFGNYMGVDRFGNKFYEIPVSSASAKRRPSRWFEPSIKDDFQSEISAEWESWLRGRRSLPPTEEEIAKNYAVMQLKKQNAIEVDAKGGLPTPARKGVESFPSRPEYERFPGEKLK